MPSLADQINEVQLILASTNDEEFQWSGSSEEIENWNEAISDKDASDVETLSPLAFALRLSANESKKELWLNATYSVQSEEQVLLGLKGPNILREYKERFQSVIDERLAQAAREDVEYVVFDVYTTLQDFLSQEAIFEKEAFDELPTPNQHIEIDRKVKMIRVIFWSHHLKAPSKKRDMTSWCSELSLWGLVKSGYPAYLCFEGLKDDVETIIKRIKSLQWHAITVRSEVHYIYEASKDCSSSLEVQKEALRHCLLSKKSHSTETDRTSDQGVGSRMTMDEVESGKELVARLKLAMIPEDEYRSALNI